MLYLRKPRQSDIAAVKALYDRSASLHRPWTYPPKDYEAYLLEEYRYFLCMEQSHQIVGTFNISGVIRANFYSAYLGYEVFSPFEGRGYMRRGLKLLIEEAFGNLNLHRLEANIQPGNEVSIKLVARAGFVREGFSKEYLNIGDDGWKHHERWALINDHWLDINL
ncbi:MAG: GNAT family N-acetyltransferase [Pseudohongiellaceae bacterium]|nr:GNAT family N-acetyltransferase [Pseudohongiellaceae bacterium]